MATPSLIDPNFWRTVVLIIRSDVDGSIGLTLNRPTVVRVDAHLRAWSTLVPEPGLVHSGGPVQPEVAIALVIGDGGEPVGLKGLSLGDVAIDELPSSGPARIYSGYSGWGRGQLEEEVSEGSWYVVPARPSDPFDSPDDQWARILKRQGGRLALMSTFPDDVTMN